MEDRPILKIELTFIDTTVELIGWLSLVTLWTFTLLSFSKLPEQIPIHFNLAGEIDNYAGKGTIFVLPIIGTVLFVGLTILNKFPNVFNYPIKITADNAEKQYIKATRIIRYLKLAIIIIFLLIVIKIANNTRHCEVALPKQTLFF